MILLIGTSSGDSDMRIFELKTYIAVIESTPVTCIGFDESDFSNSIQVEFGKLAIYANMGNYQITSILGQASPPRNITLVDISKISNNVLHYMPFLGTKRLRKKDTDNNYYKPAFITTGSNNLYTITSLDVETSSSTGHGKLQFVSRPVFSIDGTPITSAGMKSPVSAFLSIKSNEIFNGYISSNTSSYSYAGKLYKGTKDSSDVYILDVAGQGTYYDEATEATIEELSQYYEVDNLQFIGTYATYEEGSFTDELLYVDYDNEISDSEDVYDKGGTSSGNIGGTGSFSGPGGSWGNGIGPAPSTDVTGDVPKGSAEANSSSTGLFTRYAMNGAELRSVGAALYTENILEQATKAVMSFLWNSPSEALISLISYPFDVTSLLSTTQSPVIFGAIDLGPIEAVSGSRLNGTFAQIDWGTIQLSEYWGNFLDYAPHTKIELYLPWCTGSVSIDPHEVLPGSISVITNIEISKGTCVHNVFGNKGALIGTYSGTCGSQLPMTALDTSGKALALVTAAAGALVAGAAAGGAASAGIAAANSPHTTAMAYSLENSRGLEPLAARVTAQREAMAMAEAPYRAIEKRATQASLASSVAAFRTPATIQRNGSFTGNGSGMAIQFPFVIVSRPEQNIPQNYGRFFGYPSNVYTTIGSVSGYTEIGSVHVNGLTGATLDEVEEVERLLKGGVIL